MHKFQQQQQQKFIWKWILIKKKKDLLLRNRNLFNNTKKQLNEFLIQMIKFLTNFY